MILQSNGCLHELADSSKFAHMAICRLNEPAPPPAEDVDAWSDEEEAGEGRAPGSSAAADGVTDGLVCCRAKVARHEVAGHVLAEDDVRCSAFRANI